jgi:uncharacterized protein YabE (DUF348 family)
LIARDRNVGTRIAGTALAVAIFCAGGAVGRAADTPLAAAGAAARAPVGVTLVVDGVERSIDTTAGSARELLATAGIRLAPDDSLSVDPDAALTDGERIEYRTAIPVRLIVGGRSRVVRSPAESVGELLAERHVAFDEDDRITPSLSTRPAANETIRVENVDRWTAQVRQRIRPTVQYRTDPHLAKGALRVIAPGIAGVRETIYRIERTDSKPPKRTVLASKIIRPPEPRIIVRGIGTYDSLAHVAEEGFSNALHLAGSALHMIATAYTAHCYGCSGITANGLRAGFGIIAVDPRVIPLGTHVYVPGYGTAIAGDTGGAIVGNRIDLGFNSVSQALSFGRRAVTLYVLK